MTFYLLDTNIVKLKPSESLLAWMGSSAMRICFIASLTVAEIRRGILEKPRGKKRDALDAWFAGPEGPQALFAQRILSFDDRAGLVRARLMAEGKAAGRPRSGLDMIIAALAGANDCVVVTDNEKDFAGLQIINPLRGDLSGKMHDGKGRLAACNILNDPARFNSIQCLTGWQRRRWSRAPSPCVIGPKSTG
ncbi:putative nucleic acid-binding protein [Bradyrhizobium elkanii]